MDLRGTRRSRMYMYIIYALIFLSVLVICYLVAIIGITPRDWDTFIDTLSDLTCVPSQSIKAIEISSDKQKLLRSNTVYNVTDLLHFTGDNCQFYVIDHSDAAYWHQLECVLAALLSKPSCLKVENGTNNLQLITRASYKTPKFVEEIFFKSKSNEHPRYYYADTVCKKQYFDYNVMQRQDAKFWTLWVKFVTYKLNLTFAVQHRMSDKVLIIDRLKNKRKIRNVKLLKYELETKNNMNVDIIYNEWLSVREQIEAIMDEPKYIITPHGSNVFNFLYLDVKNNIIDYEIETIIIEICPPYSHCFCVNHICMYFARLFNFLNDKNYVGYVEQDINMNCVQFCRLHEGKERPYYLRRAVRDVKYVDINLDYLQMIIHDKQRQNATRFDIQFGKHHYIYVNEYKFNKQKLSNLIL